jgi:GNAT superfamily N-acetyltransferase
MTEFTIRDARLDDADAITPLVGQLSASTTVEQVRQRLEPLLSNRHARVLVGELDGVVVGLAVAEISHLIEHDQPICSLRAIVIDERHRSQGIGARMLEAVECHAQAHRCAGVMLNAGNQRRRAHAFYERMGYAATGKRFIKWFR